MMTTFKTPCAFSTIWSWLTLILKLLPGSVWQLISFAKFNTCLPLKVFSNQQHICQTVHTYKLTQCVHRACFSSVRYSTIAFPWALCTHCCGQRWGRVDAVRQDNVFSVIPLPDSGCSIPMLWLLFRTKKCKEKTLSTIHSVWWFTPETAQLRKETKVGELLCDYFLTYFNHRLIFNYLLQTFYFIWTHFHMSVV